MAPWLAVAGFGLFAYLAASHAVREFFREAARLWDKL